MTESEITGGDKQDAAKSVANDDVSEYEYYEYEDEEDEDDDRTYLERDNTDN